MSTFRTTINSSRLTSFECNPTFNIIPRIGEQMLLNRLMNLQERIGLGLPARMSVSNMTLFHVWMGQSGQIRVQPDSYVHGEEN